MNLLLTLPLLILSLFALIVVYGVYRLMSWVTPPLVRPIPVRAKAARPGTRPSASRREARTFDGEWRRLDNSPNPW